MLANPNYTRYVAVTTSDATDLPDFRNSQRLTDGLYIGATGDVNVLTQDGTVVLFKGALVGTILPIRIKRVLATGTAATNLVALYT